MKASLFRRLTAVFLVFHVFGHLAFAQDNNSTLSATGPWTNMKESSIPISGTRYIVPTSYRTVHLDESELLLKLDDAPMEFSVLAQSKIVTIDLPLPDGSMETFRIVNSPIMEEPLQTMYPDIRTFAGVSTTDPGKKVRFDYTPQGFHAMIMVAGKSTIFIDPYSFGGGDTQHYIIYNRTDFASSVSKMIDCSVTTGITTTPVDPQGLAYNTCELREYRLALAATGEYTTFHGGTVAGALAAQVTTMNRVNGIYERDFAVRMNIIANNNLLIFTNSGTDPYTNNNGGTMLGQNQAEVDGTIGSANYDIGHVFSTGGGGIAGLGVVCAGGNKARGVTGSGAPVGDPFDVDYVAHEMGHQFGANHTQNNNCNRNNATAMEPGSASTIMGYAGICAPNVQNNSDDHFHAISMQEIGAEIDGHTCQVSTPLTNSAPTITGTNANVAVPSGTPFQLTATATDPDGDILTYNWEQMNNQVSTQPPVSTSTGGPNFRSFSSTTSPTRYFPNLTDLSNGGPFTWEVLPTVTRTMNFRVTARDNAAGGSCTDYVDVTMDIDGNSGPFIVLYPSATGIIWNALSTETVTWDVANTDQAPVSCSNVDILLSTDGGLTYPTVLATNTPNDGSHAVTVPNTPTTTARIMVVNTTGTFFDISDNDFEIAGATFDYTLSTTNNVATVCSPNDAVYTIDIGEIGGYSDPVTLSVTGLPAGATSNFSVNPVTPTASTVLTISNIGAVTPGAYTFSVDATSTSGPQSLSLDLNINNGSPAAIALTTPADAATGISTGTTFTWVASPDNGATYEIDIATDAGFTTIIDQATGLATNSYTSASLSNSTMYYWRVRVVTGCGTSPYSATFSFTTSSCNTYASTNVPVAISASGTPTVTSTITVPATGTISDLNVVQLQGNHTYISDLIFTLTSPTGTNVILIDNICTTQNDFDIALDDESAQAYGTIPCPPVGGGLYQPNQVLSAFDGENPNGTWTLTIEDAFNLDGGALTGWAIEICTTPLPTELGTDVQTACDSYTWIDGNTYTASNNTATFLLPGGASNGADSLVILDLTVNFSTTSTDVQSACGTYTWLDGNTYTSSNNTATFITTNSVGCDSVITLDLTINNATTSTDVQSACGFYTWIDGNSYTSSNNTATFTTTNSVGCDSVITLDLTINTSVTGVDTQTSCGPITWIDGNSYTSSNNTATFTIVGGSVNGCDSIVTLNLTVNNATTSTDVQSACGTFTWIDGNTYTSSNNTATFTTTNSAGCDSVITLNLTINNATTGTDAQTACGSFTWLDGNTYTSSNNTATFTTTNSVGCDSVITLNLTINNNSASTDVQTSCGAFTWIDGNTYTSSTNTATFTTTNSVGCDSIITLDLTVNSPSTGTDVQTTCGSFTWIDGNTYTTSNNTATFTLTGSNGCDSVVTLNLSILSSVFGSDSQTSCGPFTWIDGNTYTSSTNTPTFTIAGGASNGCDSVVTLLLTVTNVDNGVTQLDYNTLQADYIFGTAYQWIDCDNNNAPIAGATALTFDATANGNYAVIVTDGACSDTSICMTINTIGIDEFDAASFSIFPNPTYGELTVEIGELDAKQFTMYDATGRVVMQGPLHEGTNHITMGNLARGTYTFELNGYTTVRSIVKL